MVLRLDVAANQEVRAGAGVTAEHVADAVDGGFEPSLDHAGDEPVPAPHVFGTEGGAVYAAAEGPDGPQLVEIA